MIVNIRTSRAGMTKAGFEAMKFGLDFTPYADNTFDVTVHDSVMLEHIVKQCDGTVLAKQNYVAFGGVS